MATAPKGDYPLASPGEVPIPFDVGEVEGLIIQSFTDAESSELEITDINCILVFFASSRCLVKFDGSPTRTEGEVLADTLFLPAGATVTVKPKVVNFKVFAAAAGGSGILYVQIFTRWQALTADALKQRY